MKKLHLLLIACFCFSFSIAQEWVELMNSTNTNFYEIQSSFNEYWKDKDETEKGKGYKTFKRWEEFVEPRVYPSGNLGLLNQAASNYEKWLEEYNAENTGAKFSSNSLSASSTWTAVGPMGPISGNAGGQLLKSGRLNFITLHPTDANTMWVGAPAGGLWKTTNGGTTWTTNTDNLTVNGCSDLAIDYTNTNIMYLATGDGDAGDTRSIGVLKTTDGGTTWNTTGLTYNVSANFRIRRLVIHPTNPQILLLASNGGIYRTANGGTTWSQVNTANCYDLEFHPGNPNIIYAGGTTFRRSTDGGVTWTQINNGITTTGVNRMAVAVTPNDNNYVYVLCSASSNSGFYGLYRSVDAGVTFSLMANSPNLLGWASSGNDSGGQGWYDLCVAASPLDKNEVVVGGVNVWRSTNGGSSWTLYGHWTGSGAPFTHADHHDLEYSPTGVLFNCNDGTVYRRTPTIWQEISGTMNISQIYKIGLSNLTQNLWITGHQDNGTSTWNGTTYTARIGGDGMDCFYDRTNNNNVFGETQYGGFRRSTNGGGSWSGVTTGLTGTAPWVTIWKQDPVVANRLYCGRQSMFVSNDLASNWTSLAALPVTGAVREFAIAPSNNQIIYVIKSNAIIKTTNGGSSWTNVTGSLSTSLSFFNVCVSPTDANKVWVCCTNYSGGNKVFYSSNGGSTWTNYSSNLPNLPANCLMYQPGSSDRIYVGMDVGVYYRDNTQTNWVLYNAGLPNTPVRDMEISNAMPNTIVAATYGRGVWIVDAVPTAGLPPVSSYAFSGSICTGVPKTFTDNSSNGPTSWSWSSNPSTGVTISTATSQNPVFTFANAGTYTVSLQASNLSGPGNLHTQIVTVYATPNVVASASSNTVCQGSNVTIMASGATTYTWNPGSLTGASNTVTPIVNTNYIVTGSNGTCSAQSSVSVSVIALPNVNASTNSTLICAGTSAILSASGATSYSWSTGATTSTISVFPSLSTTYTVIGFNGACSASTTVVQNVQWCTGISERAGLGGYKVHPNPFNNVLYINAGEEIELTVINALGQQVLTQKIDKNAKLNTEEFTSGIYFIHLKGVSGSKMFKLVKS